MMPYASRKRSRSQFSRRSSVKKSRSTYRPRSRHTTVIHKSAGELKGIDTDIDPTANGTMGTGILNTVNTNTQIAVVNTIDPGSASYNRIGRKIHMKSLRIKGTVQTRMVPEPTSGAYAGQTIRMVVVYDKQPSDVLPRFDEIFGRTVQDGTESTQYLDSLRYDNTGRFKVIAEQVWSHNAKLFNNAGGSSDAQFIITEFDKFIDLKNKVTIYSGQSIPNTIADMSTGGLYVIFRARNDSNVETESYVRNCVARLRYTDN